MRYTDDNRFRRNSHIECTRPYQSRQQDVLLHRSTLKSKHLATGMRVVVQIRATSHVSVEASHDPQMRSFYFHWRNFAKTQLFPVAGGILACRVVLAAWTCMVNACLHKSEIAAASPSHCWEFIPSRYATTTASETVQDASWPARSCLHFPRDKRISLLYSIGRGVFRATTGTSTLKIAARLRIS